MQPKSKQWAYVGYDDGADAIKYYNAETCKALTSHNFCNINPPDPTPPEDINVTPDLPSEGEPAGSTLPNLGITVSDDLTRNLEPNRKCKQNENEEDIDINEHVEFVSTTKTFMILTQMRKMRIIP